MAEFTERHEEFLVKAASWIKSHGEQYCPITAVKHVPGWRKLFGELAGMGLVRKYKGGETVVITPDGWKYLHGTHPELTRKRTGIIHLE